jgi:hypothetical protein
MRAKLQEIRQKLRQRMHEAVPETGKWLRPIVQRYFNLMRFPAMGTGYRPFVMR